MYGMGLLAQPYVVRVSATSLNCFIALTHPKSTELGSGRYLFSSMPITCILDAQDVLDKLGVLAFPPPALVRVGFHPSVRSNMRNVVDFPNVVTQIFVGGLESVAYLGLCSFFTPRIGQIWKHMTAGLLWGNGRRGCLFEMSCCWVTRHTRFGNLQIVQPALLPSAYCRLSGKRLDATCLLAFVERWLPSHSLVVLSSHISNILQVLSRFLEGSNNSQTETWLLAINKRTHQTKTDRIAVVSRSFVHLSPFSCRISRLS